MSKKNNWILGADCGGTNIKMALVDEKGRMVASDLKPIDYRAPARAVIRGMAETLKNFLSRHGVARVRGLGIGIAGDVDPDAGLVRFSPNLGWKNVPLKKHLSRFLRFPIVVDNDANCAALGAYHLDAKRDCRSLICLTLGTGVGGGIILGGKLYRGATGSAGEIGHMVIDYKGKRCACGNFGCAERMIGARGIILTAGEAIKKNKAPRLKKFLRDTGGELSPKTIEMAAKGGDPFSKRLWQETGEQLGCVLANCVNIFNPDRIVLSGGVSKVGDLLLKPALSAMRARAFKTPVQKVKVTLSKFDEKLGVMGAAYLLLE